MAAPLRGISRPKVVIVGAGFGGLAAAKALRGVPVDLVVIDRHNHHVFQPLLYQVATSVLTAGQIGSPIRGLLRKQRNAQVLLGDVVGVDMARRIVLLANDAGAPSRVPYDHLILATGAAHSYFGHPEFAAYAGGLKTLADAEAIRNQILSAFERAEREQDEAQRNALLTFVLVGAGPAGVEMAAALAVLVRTTLRREFRQIDPMTARIVLADMAPRILGAFADDLSRAAHARLEALGVDVRLGHSVDAIDEAGVLIGGERIESRTVIWTAGVAPSPAGRWLDAEVDRAGRVRVKPDLTIAGHPEISVIGDTASFDQDGHPLPGLAQVAMQQGRYAARAIAGRLRDRPPAAPFRYFDKGTMAVVGKGYAILQSGRLKLAGGSAWLAWVGIHLQFLAQANLRVSVFLQWMWTMLTGQRGGQLIVTPRPDPDH